MLAVLLKTASILYLIGSKMQNDRTLKILFLLPFLISACANKVTPRPFPSIDLNYYPAPDGQTPITDFENSLDSAYPPQNIEGTQPPQKVDFIIPNPSPETAVITGYLLTPNTEGTPYIADLILGKTLSPDQAGYPPMISYSDDTAMRAKQNTDGQFFFANILPGEYAILISTPINAQLILDPETNSPKLVTAIAGQITNLGIVVIP